MKRADSTLWVGFSPGMRVRRRGSVAEARRDVKAATGVYAQVAGRFAVLGPLKGTQGGDKAVHLVAECLKNG